MSHGDEVTIIPEGFLITAKSIHCPTVSVENKEKKIIGL